MVGTVADIARGIQFIALWVEFQPDLIRLNSSQKRWCWRKPSEIHTKFVRGHGLAIDRPILAPALPPSERDKKLIAMNTSNKQSTNRRVIVGFDELQIQFASADQLPQPDLRLGGERSPLLPAKFNVPSIAASAIAICVALAEPLAPACLDQFQFR